MIKKCYTVASVLVLTVFLIFGGLYMKTLYDDEIRQQYSTRVQILAVEKAAHAEQFFQSKKDALVFISTMDEFKRAALQPEDSAVIAAAKNKINELKEVLPGISIMNSVGIVSIGEIDTPGLDYSGESYFSLKEKRVYFESYYDPIRKNTYFAVIGPIYQSLQSKKIIGAIAFDIELEKIGKLMKESVDSGSLDETYLIDQSGMLLSGSEFIGQNNKKGVMIQNIESVGASECLEDLKEFAEIKSNELSVEEHTEEVPMYLNYMGEMVLGAHGYVPSIPGCVISEVQFSGEPDQSDGNDDDD